MVRDYIARARREQRAAIPKPVYTCPTCREKVTARPVEVFALKEVVRRIAKLTGGESSPRRTGGNREVGTIWDGFFGKNGVA